MNLMTTAIAIATERGAVWGGGEWLKCVEKSEEMKQCAHIIAILQSLKRQSH